MYIYLFLLHKRSSAHSSIVTVGFGKRETGKMSNGKNVNLNHTDTQTSREIRMMDDGAKTAQLFLQGKIRREDNFTQMSDYILKASKL